VLCSEKIFITQDTLYEKTIPRRPTENTVRPSDCPTVPPSNRLFTFTAIASPIHRLTDSPLQPPCERPFFSSRGDRGVSRRRKKEESIPVPSPKARSAQKILPQRPSAPSARGKSFLSRRSRSIAEKKKRRVHSCSFTTAWPACIVPSR